jgi:hypothetical protein
MVGAYAMSIGTVLLCFRRFLSLDCSLWYFPPLHFGPKVPSPPHTKEPRMEPTEEIHTTNYIVQLGGHMPWFSVRVRLECPTTRAIISLCHIVIVSVLLLHGPKRGRGTGEARQRMIDFS